MQANRVRLSNLALKGEKLLRARNFAISFGKSDYLRENRQHEIYERENLNFEGGVGYNEKIGGKYV